MSKNQEKSGATSRRDFIKTGSSLLVAGGVAASNLHVAHGADQFGDGEIKIGLVGCGGRGTGAAIQALNTMKKEDIKPNGKVRLIAMADAFGDRLQGAFRAIKGTHGDAVDVPPDRQFVGFDGYKKVLNTDIDLVILATPPGFRPLHIEAAVAMDKHIFAEKPVAVDGAGARRVLAASEEAKKKNLMLAVGLQRHHEKRYIETIDRIWDGAIGDIVFTRVYWNGGGVWVRPRNANQTELEYQMRNWYYFNWLCGDHIDEQHIHNLDVSNWLLKDFPSEGNGMGGREVRKGVDFGQIYDHHFVEFTYPNGVKMYSQCRHIKGCWNSVSEFAHGTSGWANLSGSIYDNKGERIWSYGRGGGGGHQEEHYDLFAALRKGKIYNEGDYGAKSAMTAILGRLCTYSGKQVKWDQALNSKVKLADVDMMASLQDKAPVQPDDNGDYPIAVPGKKFEI